MPSIRTFIAFDTPPTLKAEICRIQSALKECRADVRWESENKFHVTIKFLGDVEEMILPEIISNVKTITEQYYQFPIIYQNVGAFPNNKRPRVLWVGCTNTDQQLLRMKEQLDQSLKKFGFEIEDRQFHPHVTLGRVKSPSGLKNLIQTLENITFEPRQVSIADILVVKSILKPSGSEYSTLASISLSPIK
jgi:RNA 2',3'-cyclic 3'-phosphodiesterase